MNERSKGTTIERAMQQEKHETALSNMNTSHGATSPQAPAVSFAPRNWDELKALSAELASSNLTPAQYRGKPNDVMVAVMMGLELGLNPATAIQNIGVVEGTPAPYGTIVLALARRSPQWVEEAYQEWFELNGERIMDPHDLDEDATKWPANLRAVCVVQRLGGQVRQESFSVGRAIQAGLWMRTSQGGKKMPWSAYPADMLMWKARARAIRPTFSDVLKGCHVYEDLRDQKREEKLIRDTAPAEDRAPPQAALSHSDAILQQGADQNHLLDDVSEAIAKVEGEAALKEIAETKAWKSLDKNHRQEARSRYAVRLQELRNAIDEEEKS